MTVCEGLARHNPGGPGDKTQRQPLSLRSQSLPTRALTGPAGRVLAGNRDLTLATGDHGESNRAVPISTTRGNQCAQGPAQVGAATGTAEEQQSSAENAAPTGPRPGRERVDKHPKLCTFHTHPSPAQTPWASRVQGRLGRPASWGTWMGAGGVRWGQGQCAPTHP